MSAIGRMLEAGDVEDLQGLKFETPWAARLFGVTVAAAKRGIFSLADFQAGLIEVIDAHECARPDGIEGDEDYYTCWLQALEALLIQRDLVDDTRLAKREGVLADAARHRHDHQRQGRGIAPESVQ